MASASLRLFVALELPAATREALLAWREPLLRRAPELLRPVAPDALHVTLCFLGQVEAGEAEAIGAAAADAVSETSGDGVASAGGRDGSRSTGAVSLALGDGLWLPRLAPRVLAVALSDGRGELGRLQARVCDRLVTGGWFRAEARPYLPHVTLARVRARGNQRDVRELARVPLASPPALAFDGAAVALLRSHLGSGGARYEALTRVELR